jgi:hypothetical protein
VFFYFFLLYFRYKVELFDKEPRADTDDKHTKWLHKQAEKEKVSVAALLTTWQRAVLSAAVHMDLPVLLATMKAFVMQRCSGDDLGVNRSIKENLAYYPIPQAALSAAAAAPDDEDRTLGDLPWFEHHFPDGVPMAYIMSVYTILLNQHRGA